MARKSKYPPSVTPGIPRLGRKPNGWITTTFGNVLQVVSRKASVDSATKYQLVTAKRNRGGIVPRSILLGKDIKTKTQFFIKSGDFLISRRQIIHGACGIVPPELDGALVSNEYSTLLVKEGLLLDYLKYFCHTVYFQQTCFQSSVGVDVEKMVFDLPGWLRYKIHLPLVSEQQRIIGTLDAWDKAIALTEQIIATKQKRKQGLSQQLLTGKSRFREFVESDWNALPFGEIATLARDKFDPQKETDSLPCVEMEHIAQETGVILGTISSKEQKSVKTRFNAGQVLFGKLRPYLRKYAHPTFNGVCSSEIWVLSGKQDVCDNGFLFYLVQSSEFIGAANVSSGSKMPRADWDYVADIVFTIPLIEEQLKIVSVLLACDTELNMLAQKLAALKQQKKGLMQQLLTGRLRVKL